MSSIRIIAVYIIIMLMLVSCQPTPTEHVIIRSDENTLEQLITEYEGDITNIGAPANYTSTISGKILNVYINADVFAVDGNYPIKIITPMDITQEFVDNAKECLFGDVEMYERYSHQWTKQRYINAIAKLQKRYDEAKSSGDFFNDEAYQKDIDSLIERMNEAPESVNKTMSNGKFQLSNGFEIIDIETELGKASPANLFVQKNDTNKQNLLLYLNTGDLAMSEVISHSDQAQGQNMTREQAEGIARELAVKLGIEGMDVSITVCKSEYDDTDSSAYKDYDEMDDFYVVYMTKSIDGIQWTHVEQNVSPMSYAYDSFEGGFQEKWDDEYFAIYLNDDGLLRLNYSNPATVIGEFAEMSPLLDFGKIMEIFQTQLLLREDWIDPDELQSYDIYIDRITLGYAKVQRKDNADEYLLVPAWDFFGYYVETYKKGEGDINQQNENHQFIDKTIYAHSFLTINAIDGSIIDRGLGY